MNANYNYTIANMNNVKTTGSVVENPSDVITMVLYVMFMLVIAMRNPNPDAN
jgi:hypothetical protein